METLNRPINDIKPYEKNAKKHPFSQVQKIMESIKAFGFNQPIVVDKEGVVIVGHGRLLAARELGLAEVPVLTLDLEQDKANAYRLADNKLNESDWDMKLVIEELKTLSLPVLDLTGFKRDLVLGNSEADDAVPDVPKEPQSALGDIYELGPHRIMCGDATDMDQVAKLMDGKMADMFLSDPPYNVAYEGKTKDALTIQNDKMSDSNFRKFLVDSFRCADSVLHLGGVFYIWHADSEGYNFRGACHDIGWKVRQCLIWNKNSMVMGRQDYHWKHEPCLYGWKEGSAHLWNTDRTQTTVLNFDRPTRSSEHPTMKPVELFTYQITNNSKEGGVILDLFMGSGTTLISAHKSNRVAYGMELDPRYVDVIVQRYMEYTNTTEVKKNGKIITW